MVMRTVTSVILGAVLGLAPLSAQEAPVADTPDTGAAHPFYETGFYPAWSRMSPKAGLADTRAALDLLTRRIDAICDVPEGEETWENVFGALESARYELECVEFYMQNLSMVRNSREMQQQQGAFNDLMLSVSAKVDLNNTLREVVYRAASRPWVRELSSAKQRFVQQTVDNFRQGGADLPPEKKIRKREILEELADLKHKFDSNVQGSVQTWHLLIRDKAQLTGMPEEWLDKTHALAVRCNATTPDKPAWLLTQANANDVMTLCTVEATRKACWEGRIAIGKKAPFDNEPVVTRIMELRQEYAELLGFRNYADLSCHDRMVGSGDKALAFVDDAMAKTLPAFQEECRELLEYVSGKTGEKVEALKPWDVKFYRARFAAKKYDFDTAALRPYLRSDIVISGMFDIASRLYGIRIEEVPSTYLRTGQTCPEGTAEVWAPGVKIFKITDAKTGQHLGSFYFDAYTRNGKQAGSWVSPVRFGRPGKDGQPHEPHLVALVTNFQPPLGKRPGFFSPEDVDALFHEFGHVLHMVFSDTELRAQSAIGVAWDFVELPSQLNENWAWAPESIAIYARHYQTGEPMPAELVQRLIASRYSLPATENMERLCAAKQDLELHMHYAEKFAGKPLDDVMADMLAQWSFPMTEGQPSNARYIKHCISGGYAAGFYSYMWADVMAADTFSRFQKEGILNPEVGAAFRNTVLKHGDSKPAAELYRDFMGHDPDPASLSTQAPHQ